MEESSRMPALPASATASMVSMALKKELHLLSGVNQDCWLLEYPWPFVLCRHVKCRGAGVMECWV